MKLPEPTPDSGLRGNGNNSSTVCTRRSLLDLISDMGSTPIISTNKNEAPLDRTVMLRSTGGDSMFMTVNRDQDGRLMSVIVIKQ